MIYRRKIRCTLLEDGSSVDLNYFVVKGRKEKPVLLLNAAIHGEELNGIEVIMRLLDEIDPAKLNGTIYAVPIVNILAYRAGSRAEPRDLEDLNRVFPGKKDGTATERIAYLFFEKFVKKADFGIDLHAGMRGHLLMPHPRVRYTNDYTPPLEPFRALGTEIIFHNEGKKGMLTIEAGKIGKPIVCFEIGEAGRLDEEYIQAGLKGVKNFMKYFGMLEGEPEIPEKQILLKDYLEIKADCPGLFYPFVKPGEVVKKKQALGYIRELPTGKKKVIESPKNSVVIGIRSRPPVRLSTTVAWLMSFEHGEILPQMKKGIKIKSKILAEMEKRKIEIR